MNKTARIMVLAGGLAAAGTAVYLLIPVVKDLATSLRTLRELLDTDGTEDAEDDEEYRVLPKEVLDRIDGAQEDNPVGWTIGKRPQRHDEDVVSE